MGALFNPKAPRRKDEEGFPVTEDEIATVVVDAAVDVHRTLGGPGLLESVYEEALTFELNQRGLSLKNALFAPLR